MNLIEAMKMCRIDGFDAGAEWGMARGRKQMTDDQLAPCNEPGKLRSTPAMRARIRKLARPDRCDYDRAVVAVLDDLEMKLTGLRDAAAEIGRLKRDLGNAMAAGD